MRRMYFGLSFGFGLPLLVTIGSFFELVLKLSLIAAKFGKFLLLDGIFGGFSYGVP